MSFNNNAFIDDRLSYYWVGFMMADGCLPRAGNLIQCGLGKEDQNHVQKLFDYIGIGNIIYYEKSAYWRGSCKVLRDRLISYGVIPGKSKTNNITLSDNLKNSSDFWRGMVDGDGHIIINPRKRMGLAGRQIIVEEFCDYVERNLDIKRPKLLNLEGGCKQVSYCGKEAKDYRGIIKLLYTKHEEYEALERKDKLAQFIISQDDSFFLGSNNKSGVTGVFYIKHDGGWAATHKGKRKWFRTKQEAIDCRKQWEERV